MGRHQKVLRLMGPRAEESGKVQKRGRERRRGEVGRVNVLTGTKGWVSVCIPLRLRIRAPPGPYILQ